MAQSNLDWSKLPEGAIADAVGTPYKPAPWPHMVHYRARRSHWIQQPGRCVYTSPDEFFWDTKPEGPSDCTWIVPGTLEKRL
jgi:hypothetical protein